MDLKYFHMLNYFLILSLNISSIDLSIFSVKHLKVALPKLLKIDLNIIDPQINPSTVELVKIKISFFSSISFNSFWLLMNKWLFSSLTPIHFYSNFAITVLYFQFCGILEFFL